MARPVSNNPAPHAATRQLLVEGSVGKAGGVTDVPDSEILAAGWGACMSSILMTAGLSVFSSGGVSAQIALPFYPFVLPFPRHFFPTFWLCAVWAVAARAAVPETSSEAQYSLREWHAPDGLPSDDV